MTGLVRRVGSTELFVFVASAVITFVLMTPDSGGGSWRLETAEATGANPWAIRESKPRRPEPPPPRLEERIAGGFPDLDYDPAHAARRGGARATGPAIGGPPSEPYADDRSAGAAPHGDGDRIVMADEEGRLLDGNALLSILGIDMLERDHLPEKTIVTTIMANAGLERALEPLGGRILRTKVGDRYVVEAMREQGLLIGGESSGG